MLTQLQTQVSATWCFPNLGAGNLGVVKFGGTGGFVIPRVVLLIDP